MIHGPIAGRLSPLHVETCRSRPITIERFGYSGILSARYSQGRLYDHSLIVSNGSMKVCWNEGHRESLFTQEAVDSRKRCGLFLEHRASDVASMVDAGIESLGLRGRWHVHYSSRGIWSRVHSSATTEEQFDCQFNEHVFLKVALTGYSQDGIVSLDVVGSGHHPITASMIRHELSRLPRGLARCDRMVGVDPANDLLVVLAGKAAALMVHEVVGHSLEQGLVQAGRINSAPVKSLVTSMDPDVEVSDSPSDPTGFLSIRVDAEGVIAKPVRLIACGQVVHTICTLLSSPRFTARELSGNARAMSIDTVPLPRTRHITLAPGKVSLHDAIRKRCARVIGVHPAGGAYVSMAKDLFSMDLDHGFLVCKNGAFVRTSRFSVVGSVCRLLASMVPLRTRGSTLCGFCHKEDQSIPVSTTSPSVLCRLSILSLPPNDHDLCSG